MTDLTPILVSLLQFSGHRRISDYPIDDGFSALRLCSVVEIDRLHRRCRKQARKRSEEAYLAVDTFENIFYGAWIT